MNYLLKDKLPDRQLISLLHIREFAWGEEHLDYHPHYELYFCPRAVSQHLSVNGEEHRIDVPSVVISSPYSVHIMRPYEEKRADFERYVVYFNERFFDWFNKDLFPKEWFFENSNTVLFPKPEIAVVFQEQLERCFDRELSVKEQCSAFVGCLLILARAVGENERMTLRATAGEIPQILQYIHKHPKEDLSMKCITRKFGISNAKLKRDFYRSVGKPLHKVVMESRLSASMKLLRESGRSVGEIAGCCGFENEYYFYAFFKRQTGMTPLQYRREHTGLGE